MARAKHAPTSTTPGLRGRTRELELGHSAIDDVVRGRGSCFVLEGEPGIGKSRLIADLVARARSRGARVLEGAAQELERDRPFGALLDALGDVANKRPAFGDLHDPADASGPDPSLRYRVIDETVDLVEELALTGPLVLALEDLHWADSSTIIALNRLAARVIPLGVCLLATARPTPRSAELTKLVEAVEREGHRIRLGPLLDDAVQEILTEMLGAEPGPRLTHAAAGAGGNPLFVTELAQALVRDGAVDIQDERADIEEPSTPPSLRLVITRALSHLSEETLEVLRVASILGTSFSVADLARVLERPVASIVPQLDEAAAAQVLHEDADRLAFRHDLVRDAVYDDLPEAVRKALHAEAGRALAAEGRAAAVVATHFATGAEPGDAEAVSWMRRAASEVLHADPEVAVGLWQQCLDLMNESDPQRGDVAADLADGLIVAKGGASAEPVAREFLARDPASPLEWRLRRTLWRSLYEQDRHAEALEQVDAMARRADLTDGQRAIVASLRATCRLLLGDVEGSVDDARFAVQLGERSGEGYAVTVGSQTLCSVAYIRGDLEEAVQLGRHATMAGHDSRFPHLRPVGAEPLIELAYPLAELDRLEEAVAVVRSNRGWAERSGVANGLLAGHHLAGILHWVGGAWDEAIAELEAGLDLAEELGSTWRRATPCALLARMSAQREDAVRMRRVTDLLDVDAAEGQINGIDIYLTMWARSFLAECAGDLDDADRLISGAWRVVSSFGAVAHHRLLGPDYIRIKLAAGARDEAVAAVELVAASARRAGNVATANGVALLCRGLVEEDADFLLRAVEEYRRGPRPVELAYACVEAGALLRRLDRRTEAMSLLDEALGTFEAVGSSRDSRRVQAELRSLGARRRGGGRRARPASGWEALTPAEVAVVSLVCEGLTNKQVAERLFLSRRTVETHTGHIRAKLGVTTRTELVVRFADRVRRSNGQ